MEKTIKIVMEIDRMIIIKIAMAIDHKENITKIDMEIVEERIALIIIKDHLLETIMEDH